MFKLDKLFSFKKAIIFLNSRFLYFSNSLKENNLSVEGRLLSYVIFSTSHKELQHSSLKYIKTLRRNTIK